MDPFPLPLFHLLQRRTGNGYFASLRGQPHTHGVFAQSYLADPDRVVSLFGARRPLLPKNNDAAAAATAAAVTDLLV